jgi:hypothetical protein
MDNENTPSEAAKQTDEGETTIVIAVGVKVDRMRDMLIGALEGGSHYWCSIKDYVIPHAGPEMSYVDYPLHDGGAIVIVDNDDGKTYRVDREACVRGLRIMAEKYWDHFYDLVNETDDSNTADVFLQCAALGDVIYG